MTRHITLSPVGRLVAVDLVAALALMGLAVPVYAVIRALRNRGSE